MSSHLNLPRPARPGATEPPLPRTLKIVASSAAAAIAQIREQLGPDAVVRSVRQLRAPGFGSLWQKPQIEVEAVAPARSATASVASVLEQVRQLNQRLTESSPVMAPLPASSSTGSPGREPLSGPFVESPSSSPASSAANDVLGQFCLSPRHAARVRKRLREGRGSDSIPHDDAAAIVTLLKEAWRRPDLLSAGQSQVHAFVGPPGSGKTTLLCKWMAQVVLLEGRSAEVWRLDGHTANTAESLSVYAEILGVSVHRSLPEKPVSAGAGYTFVDLPGFNWLDGAAMEEVAGRLSRIPVDRVHLVLNAAYDTEILEKQIEAAARLPVSDLIFTHLDEEHRWTKLWNFVLGTNYALGLLSAGQNVPGDLWQAAPDHLLPAAEARDPCS